MERLKSVQDLTAHLRLKPSQIHMRFNFFLSTTPTQRKPLYGPLFLWTSRWTLLFHFLTFGKRTLACVDPTPNPNLPCTRVLSSSCKGYRRLSFLSSTGKSLNPTGRRNAGKELPSRVALPLHQESVSVRCRSWQVI